MPAPGSGWVTGRPANQSRAGRVHSMSAANAIITDRKPPVTGAVSMIATAAIVKPTRAALLRWRT